MSSKPAILHAIDTTGPGGAETVFLDLVQHLTLDGYDNIAIIKGAGWVEEQLKRRGVTYYIVNPSSGFSLAYYKTLCKIIKSHKVKLIQAHLLGSTLTYSLISLFLGLPLVATLHGQVDVNPKEKFIFLKNKIMQLGVNKLIAVSSDLAAYVAKRGLFQQKDIVTIYNGVDIKKYRTTDNQEIRNQLGLDNEAILVGSVGNVRPAKAYHVLIDAAKEVVARHPAVHFIIAGHQKADLMAKLSAQIEKLGLKSHVHFLGFQQDSAAFLGQMDMFALSSSSEGFSIATIEAMATGLPVVATRCGGPEEILEHEKTGLLVDANNASALAAGILRILSDKPLQVSLAKQGNEHVALTFSMDTLLEKYRRAYEALLAI